VAEYLPDQRDWVSMDKFWAATVIVNQGGEEVREIIRKMKS